MSLSDSPLISLPVSISCASQLRQLVVQQPSLHLVVETALIAVVVYLLYFQQKRRRSEQPQLTEKVFLVPDSGFMLMRLQQKDELIAEWEPEPLVPDTPPDHPALVPTYIDG
jgi:serine palmitoyltransferase